MMKTSVSCALIALTIVCVACSIPASAGQGLFFGGERYEGNFNRTLNVSGRINLEVSTGSGSINIRRGASDRVEIHGRIQAGLNWFRSSRDTEDVVRRLESNPPIEQSGSTIRIGRVRDSDAERNVSISYEITVPSQAEVLAHSGSGSQVVEGIEGRVETRTGSGSITIRDIRGDLDANTGSGSIHATDFRGALRMHTGSGSIRVQGDQTGRWELGTGSGGIDVDLPSSAAFDLNAHTGSGGISVDYPMKVHTISHNKHDVVGVVGNGGAPLNARTGSGHIRIQ